MSSENFIVIERTPTDVQSAIDTLSDVIRRLNDSELLIKMGAIHGAYAVYTRTGDARILEHIIIDLVMLFNVVASRGFGSGQTNPFDPETHRRTDLIYFKPYNTNEEFLSTEALIEGFLQRLKEEKKSFSENTRTTYSSSLRKIFKDMNITEIPRRKMRESAIEIERHLNEHPEYNHNIRSAAKGLVKYMLTLS